MLENEELERRREKMRKRDEEMEESVRDDEGNVDFPTLHAWKAKYEVFDRYADLEEFGPPFENWDLRAIQCDTLEGTLNTKRATYLAEAIDRRTAVMQEDIKKLRTLIFVGFVLLAVVIAIF